MSSGSMIFGNCRGKMGDVIFERSSLRELQRVYLKRHKKNYSLKNLAVRARLAICAKAWNHFKQMGMTDYTQREFCKINFPRVYLVTREQFKNDPLGLSLLDWQLYEPSVSPFNVTGRGYEWSCVPLEPTINLQKSGVEFIVPVKLGQLLPFAKLERGVRIDDYSFTGEVFYKNLFTKFFKGDTIRWYFRSIDSFGSVFYSTESISINDILFNRPASSDPYYFEFWGRYGHLISHWAGGGPNMSITDFFPYDEKWKMSITLWTWSGDGEDVHDPSDVTLMLYFHFSFPNFNVDVVSSRTQCFLLKGCETLGGSSGYRWDQAIIAARDYSLEHEEEILLTWAETPEEKNQNVYFNSGE